MSDWYYDLLSVIDNDTELELGNSTVDSYPKAMKILLTSVIENLPNDIRPEVWFHPTSIPLEAVKNSKSHPQFLRVAIDYVKSQDRQESI